MSIFDVNFVFPHNPTSTILHYLSEWTSVSTTLKTNELPQICVLAWIKPPEGLVKLNVDGSRSVTGLIGAGGVIRDCFGNWCHGFMHNIGSGEVLLAEAWGLATGLKLVAARNFNHILVESDSAILVNLLQSPNLDLHPLGTLLLNCKSLVASFSSCSIKHVHRERNMVVDGLARRSIDKDLGICFLHGIPDFAYNSVLDDVNGLAHPRSVAAAVAAS